MRWKGSISPDLKSQKGVKMTCGVSQQCVRHNWSSPDLIHFFCVDGEYQRLLEENGLKEQ